MIEYFKPQFMVSVSVGASTFYTLEISALFYLVIIVLLWFLFYFSPVTGLFCSSKVSTYFWEGVRVT